MPHVARTPQARQDIVEIALYIARDNPTVAFEWIDRIEAHCQLLASTPLMGRRCTGLPNHLPGDLRQSTLGSYVLFYRPLKAGIELYRVLHGARDIPAIFRQKSESE